MRRASLAWQEANGIPVRLNIQEGLPPFSPSQRLALYRAVQEGLTNIQRHAGAKNVWLSLGVKDAEICLTVQDDGVGLSSPQESVSAERNRYGILGMQERAAQLGGDVRLESWRDEEGNEKGARLAFCLPLKEEHGYRQ